MYADFEADNETDNYSRADELSSGVKNTNKTTNIYKQNPVCNGHYRVSDLFHVLQSGFYDFPLEYNNVD